MPQILNKKITDILSKVIPHINPENWKVYEGFDFITILADKNAYRFPKNKESETKMKLEKELLKSIKNKIDLSIPEYKKSQKNNFACYKELPGQGLTSYIYKKLNTNQKNKVCKDLAKFIRQLHSVILPKNIIAQVPVDNWPNEYKKIKNSITRYFKPDKYFESFLSLFKILTDKRKDFRLVHIIISQEKKKITGIIDFGDARFSDPVVDFAPLWSFGQEMVTNVIHFYTEDIQERQNIIEESNLYYCHIMLTMMVIKKIS
jgi:aminoglycoside 2''-phosphotransferase